MNYEEIENLSKAKRLLADSACNIRTAFDILDKLKCVKSSEYDHVRLETLEDQIRDEEAEVDDLISDLESVEEEE